MSDLYDLEGFLAEQGINYSNPDLKPRQPVNSRGMFDVAEEYEDLQSPGLIHSEGVKQGKESLNEFLNRLRYSDPQKGLLESLQTSSQDLMQQRDTQRAAEINDQQVLQPPTPRMDPSELGPIPGMLGPITNAVQGAPAPAPTKAAQADGSQPIPSRNDLTLSRMTEGVETPQSQPEQTDEAKRMSDILASYQQQMKDAQSEAKTNRAMASILEGASDFGAIAAGGTPDSQFYTRLAQQADQPVEDLQKQLKLEEAKFTQISEEELKDPNSEASKQARDLLKGTLPEFANQIPNFDNLSVEALDSAVPLLQIRRQIEADRQRQYMDMLKLQKEDSKDKKTAAAKAKELEATDTKATVENLNDIETALKRALEFKNENIGGTGPIASLGGARKYINRDFQALENIYNKINIKNMVSTFAGMSKAVDSDAERAAWNATQPNVANDDKVNVQILMGMQSSLLKDKILKQAQRQWVNEGGDPAEFTHPILEGTSTTIVGPNGEMTIVDKKDIPAFLDKGYSNLDDYVDMLYFGEKTPLPRAGGFKQAEAQISEADKGALQFIQDNPDHPRVEDIKAKLKRKGLLD